MNGRPNRHVKKQTMKQFSFFLLSLFCVVPSSVRAQIRLTEFCAENLSNLADEDGDTSDWIEIHNSSQTDQSLLGWSLSDNGVDSRKWSFPEITLKAGEYLVVFASGKDRKTKNRPLHTNFKLSKRGEYLALTNPTGKRVDGFDRYFRPRKPTSRSGGPPEIRGRHLVFLLSQLPAEKTPPHEQEHCRRSHCLKLTVSSKSQLS